jgi:hypothetical protein
MVVQCFHSAVKFVWQIHLIKQQQQQQLQHQQQQQQQQTPGKWLGGVQSVTRVFPISA